MRYKLILSIMLGMILLVGIVYAGGTSNKISVYIFGDLKDKTAKPYYEERDVTAKTLPNEIVLGNITEHKDYYFAYATGADANGKVDINGIVIKKSDFYNLVNQSRIIQVSEKKIITPARNETRKTKDGKEYVILIPENSTYVLVNKTISVQVKQIRVPTSEEVRQAILNQVENKTKEIKPSDYMQGGVIKP
jgi:hypothetical protein